MAARWAPIITQLLLGVLFFGCTLPASALTIRSVTVDGVDGAMRDNVFARLSLARWPPKKTLTDATLAYQLRQVTGQVQTALEPFGYYSPEVDVSVSREGKRISLRITVDRGEPVRVVAGQVELHGEGSEDPALQPLLTRFRPRLGEVLRHSRYEASKATIQRGLAERGYFRARSERSQVSVERETKAASIDLAWRTGPRHRFGATTFSGSQLRDGLLEPLLPYREGDLYSHTELLRLHRILVELDYFGLIDIQPELASRGRERGQPPDADQDAAAKSEADADSQDEEAEEKVADSPALAPIKVSLTPAKRSRYSAGLSYGTDNGASLRLGLDRRWVNARGHKLKADAELGQRRTLIGAQYRIPQFAWLPGWWSGGVSVREEEIGDSNSEIGIFNVARTARWRGNQIAAEFNVQQERFQEVDSARRIDRDSFLVYPALRLDRVVTDDTLYPTRGYSLSTYVRVGSEAIGSDIDFAQAGVAGKWIRGLGEHYRVLLRGEVASTWVDDFERLPPSLRNFAGGDRSVRGYGYQELGPRNALGEAAGGKHLIVASAELEKRIGEQWAVAVFADAGNAFDSDSFEPAVGVGLGLRWRSPVGPIRLDLGHGLNDPDQAVRLHIGIGPEL
ncbi:MAG: autotransporter assembly complex protein TamA [Pseudomarimonas sp.]